MVACWRLRIEQSNFTGSNSYSLGLRVVRTTGKPIAATGFIVAGDAKPNPAAGHDLHFSLFLPATFPRLWTRSHGNPRQRLFECIAADSDVRRHQYVCLPARAAKHHTALYLRKNNVNEVKESSRCPCMTARGSWALRGCSNARVDYRYAGGVFCADAIYILRNRGVDVHPRR